MDAAQVSPYGMEARSSSPQQSSSALTAACLLLKSMRWGLGRIVSESCRGYLGSWLWSKSAMSSHSSGGMGILGRRSEVAGYTPREGPSAEFSLLGTYLVCMVECLACTMV